MGIKTTRRDFIKSSAAAGTFFIPATNLFGQSVSGPASSQVRFAGIAVGGMGTPTCNDIVSSGGIITAICDIDPNRLARYSENFPEIPCFTDWRVMLDKHASEFDAVAISTPDHTHAQIALECMRRGKAVFVQKPLARTFEECEMLLAEQKRTGVVVQMGNQGHPGVKRYDLLVNEGAYGEVLELFGWSDRPIWPQGMASYPAGCEVMNGLDWNLWTGPAAMHEYSPNIHPFKWRGYWDYGTGAIGDMAVHNVDPAFWSLKLGLPIAVKAKCDAPVTLAFSKWSEIEMTFAPVPLAPKGVKLTWYDGGRKPQLPEGCNPALQLGGNGLIVKGSKITTLGGSHANPPLVVSAGGHEWNQDTKEVQKHWSKMIRGVKDCSSHYHYEEFVNAVREHKPSMCSSALSYATPLTQALLIGCIALRYPGEELKFDPVKKVFTNKPEANYWLKLHERPEFSLAKFRS